MPVSYLASSRQPLKKLKVDEGTLLKLLHRWREEAEHDLFYTRKLYYQPSRELEKDPQIKLRNRRQKAALHEAATAAVPARTLLWSLDLQPRLPLSHICVLTAEDILVERSCNTQQARTAATGTALRFRSAAPIRRTRTLQECGVSTLAHHTTYRRV